MDLLDSWHELIPSWLQVTSYGGLLPIVAGVAGLVLKLARRLLFVALLIGGAVLAAPSIVVPGLLRLVGWMH